MASAVCYVCQQSNMLLNLLSDACVILIRIKMYVHVPLTDTWAGGGALRPWKYSRHFLDRLSPRPSWKPRSWTTASRMTDTAPGWVMRNPTNTNNKNYMWKFVCEVCLTVAVYIGAVGWKYRKLLLVFVRISAFLNEFHRTHSAPPLHIWKTSCLMSLFMQWKHS